MSSDLNIEKYQAFFYFLEQLRNLKIKMDKGLKKLRSVVVNLAHLTKSEAAIDGNKIFGRGHLKIDNQDKISKASRKIRPFVKVFEQDQTIHHPLKALLRFNANGQKAHKTNGEAAEQEKRSLEVTIDTIPAFSGGENENWHTIERDLANAPEVRDLHHKGVLEIFLKKLTGDVKSKIANTAEESGNMKIILETLRRAYGGAIAVSKQLIDSHIKIGNPTKEKPASESELFTSSNMLKLGCLDLNKPRNKVRTTAVCMLLTYYI